MASASDFLELQLGTHVLRDSSYPKPTSLELALFKTKPNDDGTGGVEVTAPSYSRVACGPGDSVWAAPTEGSGEFTNLSSFVFNAPAEDWAADPDFIVAYGIFDQDGVLLIAQDLLIPQEVLAGGLAPKFSEGTLKIIFG